MTLFTSPARRRLCSAAGVLVVLFASTAAALPGDTAPLRSAELPAIPDAPTDPPLVPPAPPEQLPLLWNGGFPGIAPAYASGIGPQYVPSPLLPRQLAMLWSVWLSVGHLTGMTFPEWVMASGGGSVFQQRPMFGSVRPK